MNFKKSEDIKNVLIVDTLNLFIRNFAVLPTRNPSGDHNGGLFGSLNSLKFLMNTIKPDLVVMAMDGPGGSKRRREIFPEYKAGRKIPRMLTSGGFYESPDEERVALFSQLKRFVDYLKMMPVKIIQIENIEADDIIAYVTTNLCEDKNVVIASTDKDFLQLTESDRVRIFRPTTKDMVNEEFFKQKFANCNPKNYTLIRAVEGDNSDGIPGIKGLAAKTMIKLFGETLSDDKTHSIDSILNICREKKEDKTNKFKLILENEDVLRRNFKLMQLYDVNISLQSKSKMDDILNSPITTFDPFSFRISFQRDQLYHQIKNIDSWMSALNHPNNVAHKYNKQIGANILNERE